MADAVMTELLAFVRDEVAMHEEPLDVDTDLLLSGTIDSLGVIRITHWLEERTGQVVPPGDVTLENFQSVAAIAAYVERTSVPSARP